MLKNKWHEIWEKRSEKEEALRSKDSRKVLVELKRVNGYDIVDGILTYDDFYRRYVQIKNKLEFSAKANRISSVFEVGCGGGA